jgi:hypothetical protein
MATRTGKLVVDRKTGKMVEEMKEDQMMVALFDPESEQPGDYKFQRVLRSDFTLYDLTPSLSPCDCADGDCGTQETY